MHKFIRCGRLFRVNTIVIGTSSNEYLRNKRGKVIHLDVYGDHRPYLVEFDDELPIGHSGEGRGRDNRCWWCLACEVEDYTTPESEEG